MPASQPISPRKTPRQARSRDTVATILEAAARVFEADGLALATTNRIAQRAGVSVGSLYQYFPNKLAIVHALIDQYQGELAQVFDQVLTARRSRRSLQATVDQAVDAVWQLDLVRPAFLTVLHSGRLHPGLAHKEARLLAQVRSRIAGVGLARDPALSTEAALLVGAVTSEMVHALLALAAQAPRHKQAALLAEVKLVAGAYLALKARSRA